MEGEVFNRIIEHVPTSIPSKGRSRGLGGLPAPKGVPSWGRDVNAAIPGSGRCIRQLIVIDASAGRSAVTGWGQRVAGYDIRQDSGKQVGSPTKLENQDGAATRQAGSHRCPRCCEAVCSWRGREPSGREVRQHVVDFMGDGAR